MGRRRAVLLVVVAALAAPGAAAAHPAALSSFDARTDGRDVAVGFRIDLPSVQRLVAASGVRDVAAPALPAHADVLLGYLDRTFTVANAGARCRRGAPDRVALDAAANKLLLDVRFHCAAPLTILSLACSLFQDEPSPHPIIGMLRHGGAVERYFFNPAEQVATVELGKLRAVMPDWDVQQFHMATPPPGAYSGETSAAASVAAPAPTEAPPAAAPPPAAARSAGSSFVDFFFEGVRHILGGLDHVLFVLVLVLAVDGWRRLAAVITSFTIAHSITLALGALGLVYVSPRLVEPLIAASIVYVAVENVVRDQPRARAAVTFGFGLFHGLGFSGVLRDLGLQPSELAVPLVGFNLGVEAGQLLVVVPLFPLVLLARRDPSLSRRVRVVTGIAVAIVATYWVVQRITA